MPDPVPEVVGRFAAEHFVLNSISEKRRQEVTAALVMLSRWLADRGKPLEQATDNDLRAWLVWLLESDRQPSTVGWYLRMVTPFYKWCWCQRLITADDWLRLREVQPPRGSNSGKPRPYSRKELDRFWAEIDQRWPYTTERIVKRWRNGTSPWRSVRRHAMRLQMDAIIELALVCGLRRAEIYQLSIEDVHWDNHYIVVHGKRHDQNAKVREVPYPESTREAIRAWFRMRGLLGPQPRIGLWLSVTGPVPAAEMSFARMAHILPGEWQLHRLRHTCATERLRAGMELEKLQRFLGHARIEMTLRYAELVRGDIHKSSERIDPIFQRAIKRRAA